MLLVCGEALIDLVSEPDGRYAARPGGGPANTAVTLGRLGVAVSLAARISRDPFGEQIRAHLEAVRGRPRPQPDGGRADDARRRHARRLRPGPLRLLLAGHRRLAVDGRGAARTRIPGVRAVVVGSLAVALPPGGDAVVGMGHRATAARWCWTRTSARCCSATGTTYRRPAGPARGGVDRGQGQRRGPGVDPSRRGPGRGRAGLGAAAHRGHPRAGRSRRASSTAASPWRWPGGRSRSSTPSAPATRSPAGCCRSWTSTTWPARCARRWTRAVEVSAITCSRPGADPPWRRELG